MSGKTLGRQLAGIAAGAALLMWAAAATAQTGTIKGVVTGADGKPVEGATVTVTQHGSKNGRTIKTNKRGEFGLVGIFPGEYTILAEKDDLKSSVDMHLGLGDNEVPIKLAPAGPSAEQKAFGEKLQKAFDEGVALSKEEKYDDAIAKFNEALGMAPNCHDCYYNIGFANSQKKEWAAAEAAYKKATELKPDYVEAWNGLANVYNQEKKPDLALEAAAKAGQLSGGGAGGGGSASSLYNQGVILWNQNKFAEAKEKFEAATKADAKYGDAYYRLGMADLNLGDMPGAIAAFEGYMKAAPDGPHAAEVKNTLAALKK
jgi:tetratricopeptide (TPR) repeat protein